MCQPIATAQPSPASAVPESRAVVVAIGPLAVPPLTGVMA